MRIVAITFLLMLAGCASQQKIHELPNYSGHPIIGIWSFDINGCSETYRFSPDGIRYVTSNKEIVEASYTVSAEPEDGGVYRLVDKVLKDNGKEDCTGSTNDMTGDVVTLFVSFSPKKNQIMFCFDKNKNQCFGPFIRSQ